MQIDYITNMRNIYRREKLRNYRRTVIFFLGIGALAYLGILASVMTTKQNDSVVSGQAAVAKYEGGATRASESSPATSSTVAEVKATPIPTYRSSGKVHYSLAPASSSSLPQHTFQSTSSGGMTVHTTSSASVKNIGSGGGSSGGSAGGGTAATSSSSAFSTSTSIMVVPSIARVSSRNLNAANTMAAEAEIIENTATERAAKPGIRRVYDDPFDPFLDPVGEGLWALLLFAAAYGVFMFCRKRQRV